MRLLIVRHADPDYSIDSLTPAGWEEGIGRLAIVYVVCLFGFIIWLGLFISWLFFHGMTPPLAS